MLARERIRDLIVPGVVVLLVSAMSRGVRGADGDSSGDAPKGNPDREAFFGDLHLHTSWSIDAYVFGTRNAGPEEAIWFARGEPVRHPGGFLVQLKQPLDFMLLMDHSEYTGALSLANEPQSSFSKTPRGRELKAGIEANAMKLYQQLSASMVEGVRDEELQGTDVAGYSWKRICAFAEAGTEPGKFTVFPGWEWTAQPNNRNVHRNVLFKDPQRVSEEEFSSLDSMNPEDLWKWMDEQRASGNDVMAITPVRTRSGSWTKSAMSKKGGKTPGVKRQWCGTVGKTENCIVTVHLAYAREDFHCLLDGDLFLPEDWAADRGRCRAAGIPDEVAYRPKWQIALDLYDHATAGGVAFEWLRRVQQQFEAAPRRNSCRFSMGALTLNTSSGQFMANN